ncbi:MAG: hypothetical protein ACO3JL_02205 [Myxococcota bacterium]
MPFLLLILFCFSAGAAHASEDNELGPPPTNPLDVALLPLLNFTTDRGLGFGGFGAGYWRGGGDEKTPYAAMLALQLWFTTGGYQYHKLMLDLPRVGGSDVRLDLLGGYEAWEGAWYFGSGAQSPRRADGQTDGNYHRSRVDGALAVSNVRVPVAGQVVAFGGVTVRHVVVSAYSGSLLATEKPMGIDGGLLSQASVGALIDTRDQEPSPQRGLFSELSIRGAARRWVSDFGYLGLNFTHRQWLSLLPRGELVWALRGVIDLSTEGRPFFQKHILGGSQYVELGGNSSLRGLLVGRYRGDVVFLGTSELRWRVIDAVLYGTPLSLTLNGFFEAARVSDWGDIASGQPFHPTLGLGPRLTWNRLFVVRADFGAGIDQVVRNGVTQRETTTGLYILFGQVF